MDRWVGKVAIVTGASAGIGVAIAEALVGAGLKVGICSVIAKLVFENYSKSLFSIFCLIMHDCVVRIRTF